MTGKSWWKKLRPSQSDWENDRSGPVLVNSDRAHSHALLPAPTGSLCHDGAGARSWPPASATPAGGSALAELCRGYWYPLYAYVRRRRVGDEHQARDLTQEFFARLIGEEHSRGRPAGTGPLPGLPVDRGEHFLINEAEKTRAVKAAAAGRRPRSTSPGARHAITASRPTPGRRNGSRRAPVDALAARTGLCPVAGELCDAGKGSAVRCTQGLPRRRHR